MAINEQHRQLEIARQLEETARTLAHSSRIVPNPAETYDLIAELRSTISSLGQVARQLARWTANTTDSIHYQGHEESSDTTNPVIESAKALKLAATALDATYTYLDHAQGENGRIRWYDHIRPSSRIETLRLRPFPLAPQRRREPRGPGAF